MILALLISCVDYNFSEKKDPNLPEDTDTAPTEGDDSIVETYVECSGEWEIEVALNQEEVCYQEQTTGVLDVTLEWEKQSYDDYVEWGQCVMAPVVGQLTDDNGDGVINQSDDPDIVVITDDAGFHEDKHGVIRILKGSDGSMIDAIEMATLDNYTVHPYRYSNVALGDVDVDGAPEIVFLAEVYQTIEEIIDTGVDSAVPEPDSGVDSAEPGQPAEPSDNPISPPPPTAPPNNGGQGGSGQGGSGQGAGGPGGPGGDCTCGPPVECRVVAMNPMMQIEWVGGVVEEGCGGHAPFLTDLTGDGTVEVIVGAMVLDGASGDMLAMGQGDQGRNKAYAEIGFHSVALDMDGDGNQEVLAGRTIYDSTMNISCSVAADFDGFTGAADFDLDGRGEGLLVGGGQVTIFERDCTVVAQWNLPGFGTGGPPTIADYDGDAIPEIGIVDGEYYSVFEPDGTVLWSRPVTDESSHATGSVVFDFEDDAYPEVVYADEQQLWVLDGMTGEARLQFSDHTSRTLHEYPTIADVDKDGSAEIIIVNGGGHSDPVRTGLAVLGSASSNWPSARQVWNQHAYFITNVNDDLSIPANPTPNWQLYNNFRSGAISRQIGASLPDGTLDFDVCLTECAQNIIRFAVQVGNQGLGPLRAGTQLLAYTDFDTLVTVKAIPDDIPSMGVSQPIEFEVEADKILNGVLRVNLDIDDCGDGNNWIQTDQAGCPE
jgi:hypothetical protein